MVALNSLPHSWEHFKISLCYSERNLNMRNLWHHLLIEEDRKYSQGKERSVNKLNYILIDTDKKELE
jgi:hypothetical protein